MIYTELSASGVIPTSHILALWKPQLGLHLSTHPWKHMEAYDKDMSDMIVTVV